MPLCSWTCESKGLRHVVDFSTFSLQLVIEIQEITSERDSSCIFAVWWLNFAIQVGADLRDVP